MRLGRSCFLFSAFVSSVWADYYIDDTNATLTYSSGPKGAWAPYTAGGETLELLLPNGTYQVIDAFVCYNHTYRYAACSKINNCSLTVPFTGSGITVYVNQAGPVGINASISIDGAHAQTNVLHAPPAPAYQIANVSMFDVQQLPPGPHTLKLLVNGLFGSYSGMMFDYAYVNESLAVNAATTTTSASTAATSTSSSTTGSSSHNDTGAIVGGVIGAVGLILASILAFLWIRRRRRHVPETIDLHSDGTSPPFTPQVGYNTLPSHSVGTYDSYSGYQSTANYDAESEPTPFTATYGSSNLSGGTDSKTRPVLSNDVTTSLPEALHTPSDMHQETPPLLTDEQADFINSLHQNNMPAAAIARVMERMLADRHAGIQEWERETGLARSNTVTTAPPSYDLVAERG